MDVITGLFRFRQAMLYGICLLLVSLKVQAADSLSANELNKKKWEEISSGLDYTEEQEQAKPEPEKQKKEPEETIEGPSPSLGGAAFMKPLFYIIVIGAIAFVLVMIVMALMKRSTSVSVRHQVDIEQELDEENIEEWPLQSLLSKYQSQGDIRNAIRIYYLMALQLMHLNGFIRWEKDKTNSRYVAEFAAHKEGSDFAALTLLYETTWYGTFVPDEAMFRVAQQQFSMFNAQFKKPNEK